MKAIIGVLTLALLSLIFTGTQAGPAYGDAHGEAVGCKQLAELIAFVSEQTGRPPLQKCPRVSVTSAAALVAAVAPEASAHGAIPHTAYVVASREILHDFDVDLATLLGRSYLVHELVHAHQFEDGTNLRASCTGWIEGEAYRVQASYLRTHGLNRDAFAVELLGLLQSACGHQIP
jgi:hypothetical protein